MTQMDYKRTILIVEDERDIAYLLAMHMKATGYMVLSAYDGEKALEIAPATTTIRVKGREGVLTETIHREGYRISIYD